MEIEEIDRQIAEIKKDLRILELERDVLVLTKKFGKPTKILDGPTSRALYSTGRAWDP